MRIYTRKGDSGLTGLLFGGERVSKAHARTDAYGTTDEAVSALGLARAALEPGPLRDLVLRLQRELFVVGAELATHTDRRERLTPGVSLVAEPMVPALEREIDALEEAHPMPTEFVLPGESMAGAAIDLARSTIRRAERSCVALAAAGDLPGSFVVPYLNRLADLLFVMARAADGSFRPVREGEHMTERDASGEGTPDTGPVAAGRDARRPAADPPGAQRLDAADGDPPAGDPPDPVAEQRPAPPPDLELAKDEARGEGSPGSDPDPEDAPRVGVAGSGASLADTARAEVAAPTAPDAEKLDDAEVERIFGRGVALFNQARYWHAHEAWELLWRAADERDRDFYQGLIQVAAGLLHLQRRNRRGARNKLREGIEKLTPYQPKFRGIVVVELVTRARTILEEIEEGAMPYLVPPTIKAAR